jgi:hypothetical protein
LRRRVLRGLRCCPIRTWASTRRSGPTRSDTVGALAATVASASALFVGTNLDDILVLAVLNASLRADGRPKGWQIWAGQYVGIALLVVVSLLGALGLTLLPENRTWLLGSVPLGVGVYRLIAAIRTRGSGGQDWHAAARVNEMDARIPLTRTRVRPTRARIWLTRARVNEMDARIPLTRTQVRPTRAGIRLTRRVL